MKGGIYPIVTGLEHDEAGHPTANPATAYADDREDAGEAQAPRAANCRDPKSSAIRKVTR